MSGEASNKKKRKQPEEYRDWLYEIESENGVALLLDTVKPRNHPAPTARPMKVTEIVRDAVGCPKCFDLFLVAHIARLKKCLQIVHDHWKSSGEPDLGECLVEQNLDGHDYLLYSYLKMAKGFRPNSEVSDRRGSDK